MRTIWNVFWSVLLTNLFLGFIVLQYYLISGSIDREFWGFLFSTCSFSSGIISTIITGDLKHFIIFEPLYKKLAEVEIK